MAKLVESILVIKMSKLIRDSEDATPVLTDDLKTALEQVTQELAGEGVLVEVESA
jgi:hypothetical protein